MAQAALKAVPDQQNEPDQAAIDAVNLSRIRAAQESFNSETGSLRSTFARAEGQGLHLPAAKRALKVIKSGKQDEMIEEFERTVFYLKLLGKPVKSEQIELFDGLTQSAPEDERAEIEGLSAGRSGEHTEQQNPYDGPKGQGWLRGFRRGDEERRIVLSMAEPEAEGDEAEED